MSESVVTVPPPIYLSSARLAKAGWVARLIALVVALLGLASLVIAAGLTPDPRGVETHLQLGMSECGMMKNTGVPCPACGMTTSYAHLLKGHLLTSLKTQPMGTLTAFLAAVGFCGGMYIAITGLPAVRWMEMFFTTKLLFALVGLGLIAWGYKILIVVGLP